ncbi:chitin-binding protein [Streptomyces armeniacus]|uniref:Chitin-binding protein n=1 Tax=Streptomyces armeniacus TaxID=83291 RepID=A0A345XVA1_9ACTN|nr:lytic polysaccharide monooxygenase [Streptomyces armeniacus]AXK35567.1 chitin-binding protein [Streptomyces armeniacus]
MTVRTAWTAQGAETARRIAVRTAACGVAPLALVLTTAETATSHGSMSDPVSRVAACFAEGPESPQSAACKAAVEASGTQAFYDWNEVNIPNAAGKHKEIIPDGKLCSAGRDKYKGLDLARADWPASDVAAGAHTFKYKATAPHKGTFQLYVTKEGYDPSKPLKWSDLEAEPFAEVTNPKLENGSYVFDGKIPERSGRHLVYSVWQRSDSPEAFYTCSDVDFGGGGGSANGTKSGSDAGAAPAAPSDRQIAGGSERSTVDHGGHGGDDGKDAHDAHGSGTGHSEESGESGLKPNGAKDGADAAAAEDAKDAKDAKPDLAETGGDGSTTGIAVGGAAVLAIGTGVVFATLRRRAALGRHRA